MPTAFQLSVAYSRANPRRSSAWRAVSSVMATA